MHLGGGGEGVGAGVRYGNTAARNTLDLPTVLLLLKRKKTDNLVTHAWMERMLLFSVYRRRNVFVKDDAGELVVCSAVSCDTAATQVQYHASRCLGPLSLLTES